MKVEQILSHNWIKLSNLKNLQDCQYPGVYILAYSDKNLENKSIVLSDIYYVGMSNSIGGVKQRVKQFIKAIGGRRGHSAGNRFFTENKAIPYSDLKIKKTFFVTTFSLPCEVKKEKRKPADLRKMGEVAMFEYEVLAHIKDKLGKEPELNKK